MGNIGKLIAQFLLALGILIGLLYLVYVFVRKRVPFVASRDVQVLQRHYIDRNTSIVLVKVLDEYYYLLLSHSSSTVLKKLSEQEVAHVEIREPFSKILFKRLSKIRGQNKEEKE
ncbi:MAG: Flagellar biosynthesis protein FliZ, putative [Thermotoga sp. 50_1627]|uniref:flagellar biosynthetic protein FliO n=1 Tax=Pseudothermotoga sp. TaxID=2033661 RepID=UPI00076D7278|nr:MAG: Flagellar biosynthesis protein FliZ, putative [Thermotoga sp. 50_64]KUK25422.1 MAG: Flagellar biosynthesis protein FliZ, putative [Thermotoga sp. 50_1627]MBC7116757.1 flagellar biosynthetic protein FliO [Pseudothermotoga sp.]MDK2923382.1 flagellar protein FliO/FliZ [Pseudothermotoga sp.]HBT39587.1 flagellar biosynthesis protein FliZ [Pseudothermotoga sp.]